MISPVSANKGENLFITKKCLYKSLKKTKSINPKIFIKPLFVNLNYGNNFSNKLTMNY